MQMTSGSISAAARSSGKPERSGHSTTCAGSSSRAYPKSTMSRLASAAYLYTPRSMLVRDRVSRSSHNVRVIVCILYQLSSVKSGARIERGPGILLAGAACRR